MQRRTLRQQNPALQGGIFLWSGAGRNFAADAFDIGQTRRLVAPSGAERIRKAPLNAALSIVFGKRIYGLLSQRNTASEATSDMVRRFAMM